MQKPFKMHSCSIVNDLRSAPRIQALMKKKTFKDWEFEVDATLCDHLPGHYKFSWEEFVIEANTCGQPRPRQLVGMTVANYSSSRRKCFKSIDNYDT